MFTGVCADAPGARVVAARAAAATKCFNLIKKDLQARKWDTNGLGGRGENFSVSLFKKISGSK
jgi:hypothetical protein